jgi:hypothetical protein
VSHTGGVNNQYLSQCTSETGRPGKKLAFDVIDDHRVLPSHKLGSGEKPLATSGAGHHQEVAKLGAIKRWGNAKYLMEADFGEQQGGGVIYARRKKG